MANGYQHILTSKNGRTSYNEGAEPSVADLLRHGDVDKVIIHYAALIKGLRHQLDERPQDISVRDKLNAIWNEWAQIAPDLSVVSDHSAVPGKDDAGLPATWGVKKIRAVMVDGIIENQWKKQCNGKYGGPKPSTLSWKEFYNLNESAVQDLSTGLERIKWAVEHGHYQFLKKVLEKVSLEEIEKKEKESLLFPAIQKDYVHIVRQLVQKGLRVNTRTAERWTPLHWAVFRRNPEMVYILLEHNARVNLKDDKGLTPLYLASFYGKADIVSLLLEYGANVNIASKDGLLPLHGAVYNGHYLVARMLLEAGSELNIHDRLGRTLLHYAATFGWSDLAKMLLEKKADPNKKDTFQRTPLHWAAQKGFFDMVLLLTEAGAKVNEEDMFRDRPLILAASAGHSKIVTHLFEQGGR